MFKRKNIIGLILVRFICLSIIVEKLQSLGIKTEKNKDWAKNSIFYILRNPKKIIL